MRDISPLSHALIKTLDWATSSPVLLLDRDMLNEKPLRCLGRLASEGISSFCPGRWLIGRWYSLLIIRFGFLPGDTDDKQYEG